ncbi:hypothetical protein SAMD00019534_009230 [Acytostelium subglobosum LB1]|uniref:hypothetical protein n=1 Tax=Acytostelium subglobosum LB1 TaxID=1410327 RepID=UPI000644AADE|nr:hypothetical protein SAMD00019534_009230 [Acytostelium subglobosum LB1]GAM17748.1 hypothetical protein SAMD00019534_009230 [Acytostelium subglobosum LB1]|eukprot:XP_012758344.1 hypothetical protein SAMD00019534_009230 [Acytostelium subglobosum LB1]
MEASMFNLANDLLSLPSSSILTLDIVISKLVDLIDRSTDNELYKRYLSSLLGRDYPKAISMHTSLSSVMVNAHLALGQEKKAMDLLRLHENNLQAEVSQEFIWPFSYFIVYYIKHGRHVEASTFFLERIVKYRSFLSSSKFPFFLKSVREAGLNEQYVLEKLREQGLLANPERTLVGNLIEYYLSINNLVQARLIYNLYLDQNNVPFFRAYEQFMEYAIKRGDYEYAMSWLPEMQAAGFFAPITLIQPLLDLLIKLNKTQYIPLLVDYYRKFDSTQLPMVAKTIVLNEFSQNEQRRKFAQQIITVMKQRNIDVGTTINFIIRFYLHMDKYEHALLWYGRLIEEYNLQPNIHTLFSFITYHKVHNQVELMDHWSKLKQVLNMDTRREHDIRLSRLAIDNDVETFENRSEYKRGSRPPNDEELALQKALQGTDNDAVRDALAKVFKKPETMDKRIPCGTLMMEAAIRLRANDSASFLTFLEQHFCSREHRAILYHPNDYQQPMMYDLEATLRRMNTTAPFHRNNIFFLNQLLSGLWFADKPEANKLANRLLDHMMTNNIKLLLSPNGIMYSKYVLLDKEQRDALITEELALKMFNFIKSLSTSPKLNAIQSLSTTFAAEYLSSHGQMDEAKEMWSRCTDLQVEAICTGIGIVAHKHSLTNVGQLAEWERLLPGLTADPQKFYYALILHFNKLGDTDNLTNAINATSGIFNPKYFTMVVAMLEKRPNHLVQLIDRMQNSYRGYQLPKDTFDAINRAVKAATITVDVQKFLKMMGEDRYPPKKETFSDFTKQYVEDLLAKNSNSTMAVAADVVEGK